MLVQLVAGLFAITRAPQLIGTSFDLTGNSSADWSAVMQVDTSTGAASQLTAYTEAYHAQAVGLDDETVWLLLDGGVLQSYDLKSGKLNETIAVELDLALCDPPWGACVMGMHWSPRYRAFVGLGLGWPYNATLGHATTSMVLTADPRQRVAGQYGVEHVTVVPKVSVDGSLAMYEDASAFDDASSTYFVVMSTLSAGSSRRLLRRPSPSVRDSGSADLLYAFDLATGAARIVPVAGATVPFPFVVPFGGKHVVASGGLKGLPFVSIDTRSGAMEPLASGEHSPGIVSDNSMVLDQASHVAYAIFVHGEESILGGINLTSGRLIPHTAVKHTIRFPQVVCSQQKTAPL